MNYSMMSKKDEELVRKIVSEDSVHLIQDSLIDYRLDKKIRFTELFFYNKNQIKIAEFCLQDQSGYERLQRLINLHKLDMRDCDSFLVEHPTKSRGITIYYIIT